jgi:hypothetical protein
MQATVTELTTTMENLGHIVCISRLNLMIYILRQIAVILSDQIKKECVRSLERQGNTSGVN